MTFNILAIDPGNNIGISVLTINAITFEIVNIETSTYILSNYINDETDDTLLARCLYLNNLLDSILEYYKPTLVVFEEAFMNVRFPKSIIQLSQYINTIKNTIKLNNPWTKILSYPPKYIKKYVGAGGSAEKDDMRTNLKKIPEISKLINLDDLTEHSIDSISIGYVGYNEVKEYKHLLWSL